MISAPKTVIKEKSEHSSLIGTGIPTDRFA